MAACVWFDPVSMCATKDSPPSIVDFHPTAFEAKTDSPFFYSIGEALKYSSSIDPNTPTLFRGKISNFQVSPDGKRIAIISGHELSVVDYHGNIQKIGAVDSIDRAFKPIGRTLIRDDDFQWSRESKSLYFIKDKFYRSRMSQLFSEFGELWKVDVESGEQQLVIKPFRAYQIIFGKGANIYFAVPLANGDLILEMFDGNTVRVVAARNADPTFPRDSPLIEKSPVYSYSRVEYMQNVLPGIHLLQSFDSSRQVQKLALREKLLLELTYYCDSWSGCGESDEMLDSVFLPGSRFFVLNVPYCRNFKGQLLIDTQTGNYQTLPKDTRVFITANTETYPHYRFNNEGIMPK
jgi:hypothetical protein